MKPRKLIGIATLDKAKDYVEMQIPIATIVKVLGLDSGMHYRTAFDIIKADLAGAHETTRPDWLNNYPAIQTSPDNWYLQGDLKTGHWQQIN